MARLHRILTDAIIVGTILTVRGLDGVGRLHVAYLVEYWPGWVMTPSSRVRGTRLSSTRLSTTWATILPQLLRGVARLMEDGGGQDADILVAVLGQLLIARNGLLRLVPGAFGRRT